MLYNSKAPMYSLSLLNPKTKGLIPTMGILNDFLDKIENTASDFSSRVHYLDNEILIDLPGYSKEEIVINITSDNTLLVRAESLPSPPGTPSRPSRGILNTKIYISDNIPIDKMDASFSNGVLSLKYPKEEEFKPRTLEIK